MVDALTARRALYPYQALDPRTLPGGLGLVSRYPFSPVESIEGIRSMRTVLNVRGEQITLINVHPNPPTGLMHIPFTSTHLPGYNPSGRNQQLDHLLHAVRNIDGSLIVIGDFNTSDREPIYQRFAGTLRDAFAETGWGFGHTYSNHLRAFPQVRIDYIWSSSTITPLDSYVNCEVHASDHCMVIADLVW
jgi:endonuclease/exonuclease/phosphatase (EEP) superfamily protein YafD